MDKETVRPTLEILLEKFKTLEYPCTTNGSIMMYKMNGTNRWHVVLRNVLDGSGAKGVEFSDPDPYEAVDQMYKHCLQQEYILE